MVSKALRDATSDMRTDTTKPLRDDADRTGNHVRKVLGNIGGAVRSASAGFASAVLSGLRLSLIATAAVGALAAVTSLTTGVFALGGALVQASGVAAILPAALAGLAAVNATLKIGLSGISDSFKTLGGDAAEFEESLKGLAPNAQDFMRALREQKGAFDALKLNVQNRLFNQLGDQIRALSQDYLPIANDLFGTLAGQMNASARTLGNFLQQGETLGQIGIIADNIKLGFQGVSVAITPAVSGLIDFTTVGSTFLPRIGNAIAGVAVRFQEWARDVAASGELEAFIERAIDTLQQLGRIIGNVFGALGNVMDAAQSEGAGLLANIEAITAAFEEWTGSASGGEALQSFFESMRRVIDALGPAFFSLIEVIGRDFIPILADIASIIGPVLRPLFEAFGRLLQALRPLIEAIANAFATMLAALEPVMDALAKAINDAMPELQPIIDDIAEAFANLITSMIPLIPVFIDLLKAVLPILPPFIQMIADIMPKLIELVAATLPLIEAFAQAFIVALPIIADIVNFLLTVFIPVFSLIINVLAGVLNFVTGFAQGFWNVITTVFTAIGDFFSSIWESISTGIGNQWERIKGFFSGGIGDIVRRVGTWVSDMVGKARDLMVNFARAIGDGIGNVVQWFKDLPGRVFGAIGDFVGRLVQLGKDLIQGLIDGIKAMVRRVIDSVTGVINDALGAAKSLLGIASPSKVFRELGVNVGEGLALGIKDMYDPVAAAAEGLAGAAMAGAGDITLDPNLRLGAAGGAPAAAGAAAGAGTTQVVLQQTNVMREGADMQQFASEVYRNGAQKLASASSTLAVALGRSQRGIANDHLTGVSL